MSSIDSRGENDFAAYESNLVGKSEEYEDHTEEDKDQTISESIKNKQKTKDESKSSQAKKVIFLPDLITQDFEY